MNRTLKTLFDLSRSRAGSLLGGDTELSRALDRIPEIIKQLMASLPADSFEEKEEGVWIAKSAKIYPNVTILPPCIIDEEAEVRPGAFLRGNVLVGKGAVVGNSTELKSCILFDSVQVPHYNYVGDSILGYKAHLGASALTSNVRGDKKPVILHLPEGEKETGRKKFGALVGDEAEIGCGSVLNPGSIIGKKAQIYPLSNVRGFVGEGMLYKRAGEIVEKRS